MTHFTEQLGLASPELGWVPAPSYILRRSAVLFMLRHAKPGRVLEIGCGSGALLYDLHRRGFTGIGIERSTRALEIAGQLLARVNGISIRSSMPAKNEQFDYLMAFEVLEHIEDDVATLSAWREYLRPGGVLMLSVPARMELWGSSDVWAGHFRRYELEELHHKVNNAGFHIDRVACYGWPLSNVVEPIRAAVNHLRVRDSEKLGHNPLSDKRKQTDASGIQRDIEARLYPLYSLWPGRIGFQFFGVLQRRFFARERGRGYILMGRKT
jgi:SAM-dependent methyltransferase